MENIAQAINPRLIRETFGNRIYYRKGAFLVALGLKTESDIMGSSIFQALIVQALVFYLKTVLPAKKYWLPTNEAGLHLAPNENFANDIAVVEKAKLKNPISEHYNDQPPKAIIEVDVKVDTDNAETDYLLEKSLRLLNFGVETVCWILTQSRKIIVMRSPKQMEIYQWHETVNLFSGCSFCLQKILTDE
ncbi:hypothetical protein [Rhodoflexus sp.]